MSEVYKAISAIQGKLAKTGIAKDGLNSAQNYKFRGIDQVYAALSPLLAEHGLCVLPRMVEYRRDERVSMKPGYNNGPPKESVVFYVTVTAEFDFVAVSDGSTHTVRTYGEAMDSGDKATNKAMSAAYKYAAFMAFAIPTEGDNDADATTHDVTPRPQRQTPPPLQGPIKTRAALRDACGAFVRDLHGCSDRDMLDQVLADNKALTDQVEDEHELYWKGDGADFNGMEREIALAKLRVAEPANFQTPFSGG